MVDQQKLKIYCEKWGLQEPSLIASTITSDNYKVKVKDDPSVLKIFKEKELESQSGSEISLRFFNGVGAVKLFQADRFAQLLEFVDGQQLKDLSMSGKDPEALEVIAEVVSKLHSCSGEMPKGLISIEQNFSALFKRAKKESSESIYFEAARLAEYLIATEQEIRVLHGDIHHENILWSSKRGWLAIDPKGLIGERTYDLANTFYNPEGFLSFIQEVDVINRRAKILSQSLNLDLKRLIQYSFIYGCLSASWFLEDELKSKAEEHLIVAYKISQLLKKYK